MSARPNRLLIVGLAALSLAAAGCKCSKSEVEADAAAPPGGNASASETSTFDFIDGVDHCMTERRGPLLDFGEASTDERTSPRARALTRLEREGASWAHVNERKITTTFPRALGRGDDDTEARALRLRIAPGAARTGIAYVNGALVGRFGFRSKDAQTITVRGPVHLRPGASNELELRLLPTERDATAPYAAIDWVHFAKGDVDDEFALPTLRDVITTSRAGDDARRSFALRDESRISCTVWIPRGAKLKFSVALEGLGKATLETFVGADRRTPRMLARSQVTGDAKSTWKSIELRVPDDSADRFALVEFSAKAPDGARIAIAEPKIETKREPATIGTEASKRVVVVILGHLARHQLALYGGERKLPVLDAIASSGAVFTNHRASNGFAARSVAALIEGRSASTPPLGAPQWRLRHDKPTLSSAARSGGVLTAMFTQNPLTSKAFDFDQGWTSFVELPANAKADDVFGAAARWIEEHASDRSLVVVHARGGHPPWNIDEQELLKLPPAHYEGVVDPATFGDWIAGASKSRRIRLREKDKTRLWALYARALDESDRALGAFRTKLDKAGLWADTTLLVTSDAGLLQSSRVPFADGEVATEAAIQLPLVVRAPATVGAPRGRVGIPSVDVDLAATVLSALGLGAPAHFEGQPLFGPKLKDALPLGRARLAWGSDYRSLRWGDAIYLRGSKSERLCMLALDPTCGADVSDTHPIAADVLRAKDAEIGAHGEAPAAVATPLSPELETRLTHWGVLVETSP